MSKTKFTEFEVHPIKSSPLGFTLALDDEEADFFTLYGVESNGDLRAVGDFNTREEAEACKTKIPAA